MINVVTFPGLGLEFSLNRVAFHLFGRPIFWYGIIIASGMLLAVYLCSRWAPRFGIVPDHILDMMFFAVPAALVARGAGIGVDTVMQRPVQHGPDGVVHLGRGRHAGVAQGKVQYVLRAHDLGPALSMLEDLPHDVAVHPQLYHMFRNHTLSSLASLSPQALLRFKADKRIVARISPVDNPFGKT